MTPKILVVDDKPENLVAIEHILYGLNIEIIKALGGYEALALTLKHEFAIILLDVQMPEIDGYQTAEMLRSTENTRNIPIVFITANSLEEMNIYKGYESGAVDYITKPINSMILRCKVNIFIDLYKAKNDLRNANASLESIVDSRTVELKQSLVKLESTKNQLIEQETFARLGNLVAGIAHEVNTPLGVGVTASTHLRDKVNSYKKSFIDGSITNEQVNTFINTATQSSEIIVTNLMRAAEMIRSFKQIAVDELSEQKREFHLKEYMECVALSMSPELARGPYTLSINCPASIKINSYPGAFSQIITNFILNSILHGFENRNSGVITINISEPSRNELTIIYSDNGIGIPKENIKNIFEPFFTTKRGNGGSGLGMHIVYNLVTKNLNGRIKCSSQPNINTVFEITIPTNLEENNRHTKEQLTSA